MSDADDYDIPPVIDQAAAAVAAGQTAVTLVRNHLADPRTLRLPIATLSRHDENRAYTHQSAVDLMPSLKDKLMTAKSPCRVIIELKDGKGQDGETTAKAYERLSAQHVDSFKLAVDLPPEADVDVSWLTENFEVHLIAGQHRGGALKLLGAEDPTWLRVMWPCEILLPDVLVDKAAMIELVLGDNSHPTANSTSATERLSELNKVMRARHPDPATLLNQPLPPVEAAIYNQILNSWTGTNAEVREGIIRACRKSPLLRSSLLKLSHVPAGLPIIISKNKVVDMTTKGGAEMWASTIQLALTPYELLLDRLGLLTKEVANALIKKCKVPSEDTDIDDIVKALKHHLSPADLAAVQVNFVRNQTQLADYALQHKKFTHLGYAKMQTEFKLDELAELVLIPMATSIEKDFPSYFPRGAQPATYLARSIGFVLVQGVLKFSKDDLSPSDAWSAVQPFFDDAVRNSESLIAVAKSQPTQQPWAAATTHEGNVLWKLLEKHIKPLITCSLADLFKWAKFDSSPDAAQLKADDGPKKSASADDDEIKPIGEEEQKGEPAPKKKRGHHGEPELDAKIKLLPKQKHKITDEIKTAAYTAFGRRVADATIQFLVKDTGVDEEDAETQAMLELAAQVGSVAGGVLVRKDRFKKMIGRKMLDDPKIEESDKYELLPAPKFKSPKPRPPRPQASEKGKEKAVPSDSESSLSSPTTSEDEDDTASPNIPAKRAREESDQSGAGGPPASRLRSAVASTPTQVASGSSHATPSKGAPKKGKGGKV